MAAHLAPFLPNHPLVAEAGPDDRGRADLGRALRVGRWILPISWAYIRMMGAGGLRRATQVAILSANYIARRLGPHYPVLYTGRGELVAHECIIDLRPIQKETGVTIDDVAKRLIDYGFHAPTMSFPVAGTLMIEPTESEDLAELDRFCDAMIAIRAEIGRVATGDWPGDDNPLANAPHTAEMLAGPFDHAVQPRGGRLPDRLAAAGEVLAAGAPHRQRLRRPPPGLRLPAGRDLRHVTQLVLWDIDGTLVRSGPIGRQAIERAARRALDHRVDWTDDDVPQVRMSGGTDPGILLELLAHGGVDEDEIDGLLADALVHLENELAAGAHTIELEGEVLPGVVEVITRLHDDPDVVQSVLTGNIAPNAAVKVGAFGLDAWLDLEIGAYGSDHVDRNRLVPLAIERAAAKHGRNFSPTDVWVVGDTPKDMACAAAAAASLPPGGDGRTPDR